MIDAPHILDIVAEPWRSFDMWGGYGRIGPCDLGNRYWTGSLVIRTWGAETRTFTGPTALFGCHDVCGSYAVNGLTSYDLYIRPYELLTLVKINDDGIASSR